jgi:predicted DNA-binding transcriptional regulator AlpA
LQDDSEFKLQKPIRNIPVENFYRSFIVSIYMVNETKYYKTSIVFLVISVCYKKITVDIPKSQYYYPITIHHLTRRNHMEENLKNRDRAIRPGELMQILGISRSSIHRLEVSGALPPKRKFSGGGSCYYLESEILYFLKNQPQVGVKKHQTPQMAI